MDVHWRTSLAWTPRGAGIKNSLRGECQRAQDSRAQSGTQQGVTGHGACMLIS